MVGFGDFGDGRRPIEKNLCQITQIVLAERREITYNSRIQVDTTSELKR